MNMYFPSTANALDEAFSRIVPFFTFLSIVTSIIFCVTFAFFFFEELRLQYKYGSSKPGQDSTPSLQEKPKKQIETPLKASDHVEDRKYHLLLAATGSVATIKLPNIIEALSKHDNLSIRVLLSESAAEFLQAQSGEQPSLDQIAELKNVDGVYRDEDEWRKPWVRGESILHIELRRWADLMVIAPLSANSLAKVALGFSDNLVTSTVRAWDAAGLIDFSRPGIPLPYGTKKGIMVAPAMNTAMWKHPITTEHMSKLSNEWSVNNGGWFEVLRPIEKELACGDTGSGAMRDWKEIVASIETRLGLSQNDSNDSGNGWEKVS